MNNNQIFHEVKVEGDKDFLNYAKVYIDGESVRCRRYIIEQSVDEVPTVTLTLLGFGDYEHLAKVEIADMENIAKAMDKDNFDKFCEIWNELHN